MIFLTKPFQSPLGNTNYPLLKVPKLKVYSKAIYGQMRQCDMLMDNIDKDEKTETKVTKTTKEIPNYQERSINKMFENSIFSLQGPTYLPIEKLD